MVYIREAHPTDGWQVQRNLEEGVLIPQTQSMSERVAVAETCAGRLGLSAPVLLDGMDNRIDIAYNAWPERLYVISQGGTVLYQGGKGPYGFDPDELEAFLAGKLETDSPPITLTSSRY